jgi:hypothetical protein
MDDQSENTYANMDDQSENTYITHVIDESLYLNLTVWFIL